MSVSVLNRYKGGKPEDMIAAAKKAKTILERNGAEYFGLSRFFTGDWVGEWAVVARFPDWATLGKAQDALAKDAEYQKLVAHVLSMAQHTARNITVSIDL